MSFKKNEWGEILRALEILKSGEVLLGVDVDKELIGSLCQRISKKVNKKTKNKIHKEVKKIIKECRGLDITRERYDFDTESGPSYPYYPYSETLRIVKKAIAEGKNIKIKYYSASSNEFTEREVEPNRIERRNGTPYLVGFCLLRNDNRIFKLSRIKEIEIMV